MSLAVVVLLLVLLFVVPPYAQADAAWPIRVVLGAVLLVWLFRGVL